MLFFILNFILGLALEIENNFDGKRNKFHMIRGCKKKTNQTKEIAYNNCTFVSFCILCKINGYVKTFSITSA